MSLFGHDVWELLHISLIFNCAIKNCAVHSQKFSHVSFFVFIGYEDLNTQKVKNLFFLKQDRTKKQEKKQERKKRKNFDVDSFNWQLISSRQMVIVQGQWNII